jgi:hypothetical protein
MGQKSFLEEKECCSHKNTWNNIGIYMALQKGKGYIGMGLQITQFPYYYYYYYYYYASYNHGQRPTTEVKKKN